MTFPRPFDCTYVNSRKYEFSTSSGRSTISGRRAIFRAPIAPRARRAIGAPKGRVIYASFSWGFETI